MFKRMASQNNRSNARTQQASSPLARPRQSAPLPPPSRVVASPVPPPSKVAPSFPKPARPTLSFHPAFDADDDATRVYTGPRPAANQAHAVASAAPYPTFRPTAQNPFTRAVPKTPQPTMDSCPPVAFPASDATASVTAHPAPRKLNKNLIVFGTFALFASAAGILFASFGASNAPRDTAKTASASLAALPENSIATMSVVLAAPVSPASPASPAAPIVSPAAPVVAAAAPVYVQTEAPLAAAVAPAPAAPVYRRNVAPPQVQRVVKAVSEAKPKPKPAAEQVVVVEQPKPAKPVKATKSESDELARAEAAKKAASSDFNPL
jgi:hypothetical protein